MKGATGTGEEKIANVVGIIAKSVGIPPVPGSEDTPKAWKEACRRILIRYANEPARFGRGKPKSAGKIRNEIMQDFDTFTEKGTPIENRLLTRNTFTHFFKSGTNLNETSFKFVERFVRNLQPTDWYIEVFEEIISYRKQLHKSALMDLYSTRNIENLNYLTKILVDLEGSLFLSPKLNNPTIIESSVPQHHMLGAPYVALYIGMCSSGVADATAIYSRKPFSDLRPADWDNLVKFHGYLIPFKIWEDSGETNTWFKLNLHRRAYTGSAMGIFSTCSTIKIFLPWKSMMVGWEGMACQPDSGIDGPPISFEDE